MFKPTILILSTAAAAVMLAAPLSSQEIIVSPQSEAAFVEEVTKDLDTQIRRIHFDPRWDPAGIVKVRFYADADGTPRDVMTYESSGNRRLDRKVMAAVGKLDTLAPLPASAGSDPVIQANVIIARTKSQFEDLSEDLAESEASRLASGDVRERAVLALNMTPQPSS